MEFFSNKGFFGSDKYHHPNNKLTLNQHHTIYEMYLDGWSMRALGHRFGVDHRTISRVINTFK